MPSPDVPQIIITKFVPNSTLVIPNKMNRAVKMTVKFSSEQEVSFIVLKGEEFNVKCGSAPPVIIMDDIENEGDTRFKI